MKPQLPRELVLVIADISGYTKYMIANEATLAHAHLVIAELLKAVIREIKVPLKVAKYEGDAVFLYGLKSGGRLGWEERRRRIRERLPVFFRRFRERALELQHSRTCECGACANVDRLRLKLMVHSGQAVFYRIGRHEELAGPDVILIHRLLKNSLRSNEYILFTDRAFRDLDYAPESLEVRETSETYDHVGTVGLRVHFPYGPGPQDGGDTPPLPVSGEARTRYASFASRMWNMLPKMMTMIAFAMGFKRPPACRNLPALEAGGKPAAPART